jgi:hypothetical protein
MTNFPLRPSDVRQQIASAAASMGKVKHGRLLASVHRDVSVELSKGNHAIPRAGVPLYSRGSGHALLLGLRIPTAEVESAVIPRTNSCFVSSPFHFLTRVFTNPAAQIWARARKLD